MSVLRFLYDFVVGDDPWLFAVVGAGVAATAAVGANAWWLLPVVVCAGLAWSVRRR
ncbi:hypothetical protein DSM104299_02220 [Baekduia alba]|uniref:hypothetical protein n=1 Tax=Baekduia alba TaxID=2997333 RepID=UPI002340017B|nr:hypothetical protein [Baekduia alba]WCB93507.1 hypothetical protein DSM104299_02220 [Baekduia alba]